ncbi:hypothetical protein PybrP1_001068 [[Pythium] brassicae (nom. inval.)]|nr:hypothetical protein PybrP1_001068 [[Pythium] brassicae (nom. inval.)]
MAASASSDGSGMSSRAGSGRDVDVDNERRGNVVVGDSDFGSRAGASGKTPARAAKSCRCQSSRRRSCYECLNEPNDGVHGCVCLAYCELPGYLAAVPDTCTPSPPGSLSVMLRPPPLVQNSTNADAGSSSSSATRVMWIEFLLGLAGEEGADAELLLSKGGADGAMSTEREAGTAQEVVSTDCGNGLASTACAYGMPLKGEDGDWSSMHTKH